MKQSISILFFLILPFLAHAQTPANASADSTWIRKNYTKKEVYIPMRDGTRLYTAIYQPKNDKERHPILINRTPYSIAPYGVDSFKNFWSNHYSAYFKENYIIVLQDVRGCYMSEGKFVDVRPYKEHKGGDDIDEASDTYDTIDWLLENTRHNNGKVGVFGISYPGFYATEAALCGHPALKAVSPQAPVTDWFAGDDFHHNGAFMEMDAFNFYSQFGAPHPEPCRTRPAGFQYYTKDNYNFYLNAGSLSGLAKYLGDTMPFWHKIYEHPNYDQWWKARNTRNFVQDIPKSVPTLVVGGLYDAEDCFGAWNLYKAIEKNAHNENRLVMGPWSHGGWARTTGEYLGNVRFGSKTSEFYQNTMEIPFFNYYLKGKGSLDDLGKVSVFFSGKNEWRGFKQWPPAPKDNKMMYLHKDGTLSYTPPAENNIYTEYTSDPAKPVPYTEDVHFHRTREYMTDDQRFASRRPDVLVYQTPALTEDVTLAGPVVADLFTEISTTDADFVVKLVDVFPDDFKYNDATDGKGDASSYPMGGYQMLVRGEVMRGRYRNSLEKPEAFTPGAVTEVKYKLPDVAHVFKKGHRIMVQIQSTWFPLVDRNPQQFIDIYKCTDTDFEPCDIKIYESGKYSSGIMLPILPKE